RILFLGQYVRHRGLLSGRIFAWPRRLAGLAARFEVMLEPLQFRLGIWRALELPAGPRPVVERAAVRPALLFPDFVGALADAMLVGFRPGALGPGFGPRALAVRLLSHERLLRRLDPRLSRRSNCASSKTLERRPESVQPKAFRAASLPLSGHENSAQLARTPAARLDA